MLRFPDHKMHSACRTVKVWPFRAMSKYSDEWLTYIATAFSYFTHVPTVSKHKRRLSQYQYLERHEKRTVREDEGLQNIRIGGQGFRETQPCRPPAGTSAASPDSARRGHCRWSRNRRPRHLDPRARPGQLRRRRSYRSCRHRQPGMRHQHGATRWVARSAKGKRGTKR